MCSPKSSRRIACDLDGVVCDWATPFRSLLQSKTSVVLPDFPPDGPQTWDWAGEMTTGDVIARAWQHIDESRGGWWASLPAHKDFTPDVAKQLERLCHTAEVTFVTNRRYARNSSHFWLTTHLDSSHGLHVVSAREDKWPLLAAIRPHFVIEDKWQTLFDYACFIDGLRDGRRPPQLLLVDRPYNRNQGEHRLIVRCASTGDAIARCGGGSNGL